MEYVQCGAFFSSQSGYYRSATQQKVSGNTVYYMEDTCIRNILTLTLVPTLTVQLVRASYSSLGGDSVA